jgi:hypothetical protein
MKKVKNSDRRRVGGVDVSLLRQMKAWSCLVMLLFGRRLWQIGVNGLFGVSCVCVFVCMMCVTCMFDECMVMSSDAAFWTTAVADRRMVYLVYRVFVCLCV